MFNTNKIFISGTTSGLRSYRKVVSEALTKLQWVPLEQPDFSTGQGKVVDMLRREIEGCDAVICLVGPVYGTASDVAGPDGVFKSYTRLEFEIACELGKPIYIFIAREDAVIDEHKAEPEWARQAQASYLATFRQGTRLFHEFRDSSILTELILRLPLERAHREHRRVHLPAGSGLFVGREDLLAHIREKFIEHDNRQRGSGKRELPVQVLTGFSGIGKTRVAIEYGHRYEGSYSALLFITAESGQSLQENLANLVGVLYHEHAPERSSKDEEVRIASVLRWLAEHPGWLLIMDNVDDENTAREVEKYLDRLRDGYVIITGQISGWRQGVEATELNVIQEDAAVRYLLESSAGLRVEESDDRINAQRLYKECDGLVQVLEQITAYIKRHRISMSDYLRYWEGDKPRLLDFGGDASMFHKKSLAHSWNISMERSPIALRDLARVLAWMHPDALPRSIFRAPAAQKAFTGLLDRSSKAEGPDVRPEEVLADLIAHCFIKHTHAHGQACVTQHRLMQEIARIHTSMEERPVFLRCAVELIASAIPEGSFRSDHAETWRWLGPHALKLLAHSQEILSPAEHNPVLMQGVSEHLLERGDYQAGYQVQSALLEWHQAHSGSDEPDTWLAHNDLANFLMQLGKAREAEKHVLLALRGREARYGSQSREAAESLTVLGQVLQKQERHAEALEVLTAAVGACRTSNGPDHWTTLIAEGNLLQSRYRLIGGGEMVLEESRKLLARSRKALPPGHTDVLERMLTHARRSLELGHIDEARSLALEHVKASEAAMGASDPHTNAGIAFLWQVAGVHLDRNDHGAAASLLAELTRRIDARDPSADRLRSTLLVVMNNIVMSAVKDDRVLEAAWAVLSVVDRELGADHDLVIIYVRRMADVLEQRKDGAAAIGLRRRALEHTRARMEKDKRAAVTHAIDLNNLAHALRVSGDPAAAEPYQRQALDLDMATRGADHPKVAHRLMNLALTCLLCGRSEEAIEHLNKGWALLHTEPDVTGCRILVLRATADLVRGHHTGVYVGMLRSCLAVKRTNKAEVDVHWVIDFFFDWAEKNLTSDQVVLLKTCVAAIEAPLDGPGPQDHPVLIRITPQPLIQALD